MSIKMTLSNRLNIVLALAAMFLLVLGTNRIDQRHFETAQKAVTSVFNDRVLAQDYIYKLNNLVHKKKQLLKDGSKISNTSLNTEIETLITLYSETKLTVKEGKIFNRLKRDFEDLKTKEAIYFERFEASTDNKENFLTTPLLDNLKALLTDLDNLALIQVSESKMITENAQKSLNVNKLLSNLEIYFLLAVGIIILTIIFYRIEKSKGTTQPD